MAEWLYEDGIGERRAALIAGGVIVEALVERDDDGPRVGSVVKARLGPALRETGRAIARTADGTEIMLRAQPPRTSDGSAIRVEIVREAIPDAGDPKPAQGRVSDDAAHPGPTLRERIAATGSTVRDLRPHEPDLLEAAGWSEVIEEARSGRIGFAGGLLRVSLTPAMTLIDVDGALRNAALAIAGAEAAAQAIRRHGIAGSIGIDLPTVQGKAERSAAAEAIDRMLPQPFERTAVNGFGFIQIVRPRLRPSLPERIRATPVETAALALLRRAEREAGACTLVAAPAVIGFIEERPALTERLARRRGGAVALRGDPARPISAGDAIPIR